MSLRPDSYEAAKASYKPMQRTKRLGPGKKTKAWDSARATIKRRFEKAGITTCELRGSEKVPHDCGNDNFLGFAHDAKRRKLAASDLYRVILICHFVHDIIEVWPPEKMKAIVNETIENRKVQP
ncbi:MAG TPA: hypothetical protein VLG74_00055 [Blastocatellia bacterium]|nr:hypothetical protein [Blastocatellia bacterium]